MEENSASVIATTLRNGAAANNLEPLSFELQYAGHTLKQVFREKRIAIYARARPNREPHEFELVVIRDKPAATLPNGSIVPEREAYPQPSEWGRWAWSFPIREREFVFGLATSMAAMEGPYGAWVREQLNAQARRERLARVRIPFAKRLDPFQG